MKCSRTSLWGYVNDLYLISPDRWRMMQWLNWCLGFSIPTGKWQAGQNVELVPISNCKYSWVLSLSSTVLCVNLARENVKGNIFNLMIVGMGLIIWLVGTSWFFRSWWFIENLTGKLRLKTLLIVLVYSVSISHNKETAIKKKSHMRLLMICAIYPVCTCMQGGLCMHANVMRAEMHMPGGSDNPYQVKGVSR